MTSPLQTDAIDPARVSLAPLDEPSLTNLARLDPTGVNRLLPRLFATYRTSLAQLLAQLRQANDAGDLAGMRMAVHTLKSSSASIGALRLAADCALVEQAARDGLADGLPPMIAGLLIEASRVDAAVQSRLTE